MIEGFTYIIQEQINNEPINRAFYITRHILMFLRDHQELLEDPEYKRLYTEALEYQIRHQIHKDQFCTQEEIDQGRHGAEFVIDLMRQSQLDTMIRYTKEDVDAYLAQRRRVWNL